MIPAAHVLPLPGQDLGHCPVLPALRSPSVSAFGRVSSAVPGRPRLVIRDVSVGIASAASLSGRDLHPQTGARLGPLHIDQPLGGNGVRASDAPIRTSTQTEKTGELSGGGENRGVDNSACRRPTSLK